MDDRTALLGEEPSTPREKSRGSRIIGKEFARFFVLGIFVAVGVFVSADFIANIPARRGAVAHQQLHKLTVTHEARGVERGIP